MISKFQVDYCYNCDGGDQEKETAINAIKKVFDNVPIEAKGSDDYPIKVVIKAFDSESNNEKIVWTSHQRNLFRKYPELRTKSIDEIVKACEALK
ncbi:hypothetical protein ABK040_003967 [Willaertia magna]